MPTLTNTTMNLESEVLKFCTAFEAQGFKVQKITVDADAFDAMCDSIDRVAQFSERVVEYRPRPPNGKIEINLPGGRTIVKRGKKLCGECGRDM